ncbi:hypothetical protein AWB80_02868 [Caballeronia pedi]|uniref:Uncharacterized protein n=1 Tax=Caballeronia pedi TaxID=1777141 RepID=A0A158B0M4_9BURK|nr:hypothetical protein [Caballeronia pedi]SAK63460.1 hypothetical protein AWB80_02868 [Caballeronia pedi]
MNAKGFTMMVRLEAIRHRLAADNERLREALALIAAIGEGHAETDLRNCARIARNALLSAEPENKALRHEPRHPEQETS